MSVRTLDYEEAAKLVTVNRDPFSIITDKLSNQCDGSQSHPAQNVYGNCGIENICLNLNSSYRLCEFTL